MLTTFPYRRVAHADAGGGFDYVVPDSLEDHARAYVFLTTVPLEDWVSQEYRLFSVYAEVKHHGTTFFWDHLRRDGYDVPVLPDCPLPPIPWPFFEAYMREVEARR